MSQEKNLTNVNFCSRFRDLVESSGKTQKEIAEALAMSEGAIVNYKRDRFPKAEELYRIAKFFGVTMEWLLTGESEQQPKSSDGWKQRALLAEQKLEALKSGLVALVKKY